MRLRVLFLGIIFCTAVDTSPALSSDEGKTCAKENDAGERLLCYDGLFRSEVKNETPTDDKGKWLSQSDTSKLTDSSDHYISLSSSDTIRARFGGGTKTANLTIRCMENTSSAYFVFGDQFLSDIQGYGRITYRIDDKKAETKSFIASTDHKALGLWSGESAIPFIKKLSGAKQMIVRMTPYNESPLTVTFDLRGFDAAIKPVSEACKWKS